MFYTVYKITNNINGKIYIGTHKTNNPNDGYMGSGKWIKRSIAKYGVENFTKTIIEIFDNPEDMFEMELILVNEDFVSRKDTYNLVTGGMNTIEYVNSIGKNIYENHAEIVKQNAYNMNRKMREKAQKDIQYRNSIHHKRMESLQKALEAHQEYIKANGHGYGLGSKHSEETKQKLREIKRGTGQGKNNSQYGTCWIYSPETKKNKKINKDELPTYLTNGWIKGRLPTIKKRITK